MAIAYEGFDFTDGGICAAKGFKAAGVHCGIRKNKSKKDLALIFAETLCNVGAVYTQNKAAAAPIVLTKEHLQNGTASAIIVNSGNANACTADGEEKAKSMAGLCARELNINPTDVIVSSTGVIGETLPIEPIMESIEELSGQLSEKGSKNAAQAIMTTDTYEKEHAVVFSINGKECHLGGIAKGSGMIEPNMATMLCFITTDVNIEQKLLNKAVKTVADDTFNMVSIDGDTSTNDMAVVMASGLAENKIITEQNNDYQVFVDALFSVMMNLSRDIAKDGEGATKLLECVVTGAKTKQDAKKLAKSVIKSSLFKSMMFGSDANWGRIICAMGYSEADFSLSKTKISLSSENGTIEVCENGMGIEFCETKAKEILSCDEIRVIISVGKGEGEAIAWGCDLTYDYVKINGDYRT